MGISCLPTYLTGALWIGIGAALALLAGRERIAQLRWLGLTIPARASWLRPSSHRFAVPF